VVAAEGQQHMRHGGDARLVVVRGQES
jgi:hypothetical protein